MEIGVARFASVFPVAQKNVVIFSSYLQSAGLGREPDLRLKSKNCLDFRTSIGNPAWQLPELQVFPVLRKPHIYGFTNSTWHSSGALSSVRKYFYQDKLCKRCMQRYGLFDLPSSEELRCFSPARRHVKRRTVGSCTSGGIAEIQDAITAYWRPALEEILLISGIALAYVAGISNPAKPAQKSFLDQFRRKETSQGQDSTLPHSDSKAIKDKEQPHNCYYSESKMWDTLQEKIETAALQVQSDDVADYAAKEKFNASTLILEAIDRGPRLRLLLSTVEFLRKEAV